MGIMLCVWTRDMTVPMLPTNKVHGIWNFFSGAQLYQYKLQEFCCTNHRILLTSAVSEALRPDYHQLLTADSKYVLLQL